MGSRKPKSKDQPNVGQARPSSISDIPALVPSSSSELDALLDRMLEIQTGSGATFHPPSETSTSSQSSIPRRDSSGIVESLLGEDRAWTEPSTHSGMILPAYYPGPHLGLYPNPLEQSLPYYSGVRHEYPHQSYLHQQPPLHSYGYTMYGIPTLQSSKFRQRHPFERAISSPEFFTPRQIYGEARKLGSGQSQSLPTFEGSTSDLDQPVPKLSSSPDTSSPSSKSPTRYGMESSLFSYGSSPSLPGPSGLQKIRKSPPAQFICAVCGDSAQCLHYGVRTCEGCKGFFKRSVQKKSKYVCLGNKDCVIDKRRRNRCQYCRYQKCLTVGMVKEVVRTDSLKGRRGRLPSKSKSSDESSISGSQSLTKALVSAFTSGNEPYQRTTYAGPSGPALLSSISLTDSIAASINTIHRWTDHIPGWARVVQSDKDKLIRHACVSILSFRIAYFDRKLVFDDGTVYSVNSCEESWIPWLNSVVDLSFRIKTIFGEDLTGFCCLKALLLFMPENANLDKVEECDKIKNNIINSLKEHCTYSAEAKTKQPQYFSAILALVNEIYAVGNKAKEVYLAYKWKPLQMPSLIADTFGSSN